MLGRRHCQLSDKRTVNNNILVADFELSEELAGEGRSKTLKGIYNVVAIET